MADFILDRDPAFDWIALAFYAILLLGIIFKIARRFNTTVGSSTWTLTQAVVRGGYPSYAKYTNTVNTRYNEFDYRLVLQYSYTVAGEYYSGYLLFKQRHRTQDGAMAAFAGWKDRPLMVRYDPAHPQRSVCLRDDGAPADTRSLGDQPPPSVDLVSLSLE
jgi:hypothetical protein